MPEIRIQIEDDDADVTSKSNTEAESIEDIRRRGDEAAAEAARLRHEAAKYRAEGAHNRIVAALGRTDLEGQEAQSEYRSAVEAGDSDAQTRAQARMTEVEARRVRLLEHEQALRNAPVVPADPVEAACAGRTTATADWLRSHPEHVRDPKKLAKLQAAHFDAEAEGLIPDTREYFDHIERRVGIVDSSGNERAARPKPAPDFNPSDVNTHIREGGRVVTLTRGEKEAATDGTLRWNSGPNRGKPIGVAEFARRKVQMAKQGYYDRLD
jgi:hypothetical protein